MSKPSVETFVSPRESAAQVVELGHDLFELLMLQVDQGMTTQEQAFDELKEAAENPEYADQLLGRIAIDSAA